MPPRNHHPFELVQTSEGAAYAPLVIGDESENDYSEKTVIVSKAPSSIPLARGDSATAYLVVISGDDIGRRLPLGESSFEAGRSGRCELGFQHESVSRRHARISWTGSCYRLTDLGSTNGTFVNEERIVERDLKEGDRIRLGQIVLKLSWRAASRSSTTSRFIAWRPSTG